MTQVRSGYHRGVQTHERARRARRALTLAAVPAAVVMAAASPAAADTPAAWGEVPDVSVLGFLLVLVILPVGLFLVIALLAFLPSLRDTGYEPGAAWRGEPEWFGSPRKGLAAADEVTPEQLAVGREGTGGTSGSW